MGLLGDRPITLKDLHDEISPILTKLQLLHDSIHGNGRPGIKTEIATISARVGFLSRFMWAMLGGGVTILVGLAGIIIKSRISP